MELSITADASYQELTLYIGQRINIHPDIVRSLFNENLDYMVRLLIREHRYMVLADFLEIYRNHIIQSMSIPRMVRYNRATYA